MSNTCPLNFEKVDANASRINSLLVALLLLAHLYTLNILIIYFLVIDFTLKLFINKKFSPLVNFSNFIRKSLKIEEKMTDGGAKRLAGIFGLILASLLIFTNMFNLSVLGYLIATIYLVCLFLDIAINYCLGCKVYYLIKKLYPSFMN